MTSKNQITLPKAVVSSVAASDYFEVDVDQGRIVLTPVRISKADALREKLAELDLTEQDITDAVRWSRRE